MEENALLFVGQDFGGCVTIWRCGITFPFGHDCPSPIGEPINQLSGKFIKNSQRNGSLKLLLKMKCKTQFGNVTLSCRNKG
jgi:hypothetical protein